MLRLITVAWFGLLAAGLVTPAFGADDPAEVAFFEQQIRPVLAAECYSCHSASAKAIK